METLRLRLRLSLFLIPRLATKPHTSLDNDAQYCVKRDLRGYEDFLHTRPQTEDYSFRDLAPLTSGEREPRETEIKSMFVFHFISDTRECK